MAYKNEWYGETARLVERTSDCSKIQYDCNGYGCLTSYDLFPGISLVFTDFSTNDIFREPTEINSDILEIRHCVEGRIEFEFPDQKFSHLHQDEFCINAAAATIQACTMPVSFSFPYEYYQGVSLVIEKHAIKGSTKTLCTSFDVDIMKFGNELNLNEQWYICNTPEIMSHIYSELYAGKGKQSIGFFRIKVLELLYHASKLKHSDRFDATYYSKQHIEIVRKARNQLISDLGEKISLQSLIENEPISMVTFQAIFKQVYGASPYSYLKHYKMNYAAVRLSESDDKISEIAITLGYSNASKFSKAFVDIFGVLPKDYRKKK